MGYGDFVKAKSEKNAVGEAGFDPVLFAATVPARKPTPKDIADSRPHPDDLIEPRTYSTMDGAVTDL